MDVVSTVELNRIGACNMLNLDLNAVMVEIINVAEYLVRLLKHSLLLSVLIGVQNYVASERYLIIVEGPNMNLMYLVDALDFLKPLPNLVHVEMRWSCLQNEHYALPERDSRGVEYD